MDTLILLENLFYFALFIAAFYYFTKGRWQRNRPSMAEEMTLANKSIEEVLSTYLDKPVAPPVEPEPQNITVPKHIEPNLPPPPPPPPPRIQRRTTTTKSMALENIKKGLLYDIIWKRKYGK